MTTIENSSTGESSTGVLTGILVVVVILLVAWVAYANGWFRGADSTAPSNGGSLQIDVNAPTGGGTGGGASGGGTTY